MTMILGINLSDRFYLAGDTRLSYRDSSGEVYVRHDNIQKVEYLAGTGINQCLISMAGDAAFAKYIVRLLRKEQFARDGIASIRDTIEDWLRPTVDKYFSENDFTNATLIIGGTDANSKKIINGPKWTELANAYTGGKGPIIVKPGLLTATRANHPIPDGDFELGINDTKLFAIGISQQKGIEIIDSKWGDVLLYGQSSGIIRQQITSKEIGELEFGVNPTGSSQSDQANGLLVLFVTTLAQKYNLETVGGAVLIMEHDANGETYVTSGRGFIYSTDALKELRPGKSLEPMGVNEIIIENNRFYRVVHGTKHRLIPVTSYKPNGSLQLLL